MRTALVCLLMVSTVAGCWSWSFPEERFNVDGGADASVLDGAADLERDGTGDSIPDIPSHECTTDTDCSADPGKPICDPASKRCVACLADKDCTYDTEKKVCDLSLKTCVGCVQSADCIDPDKKVCDLSLKTCVGCLGDGDCTYSPGEQICNLNTKSCVACLKSSDCTTDPSKVVCDATSNTCVTCLGNSDCTYDPAKPVCDTSTKTCVGCLSKFDCVFNPQIPVCDTGLKTCVGCLGSTDCTYNPAKPVCNVSVKICVGCLVKADCPGASVCDSATKTCVGCNGNADCPINSVCDTSAKTCVGCLGNSDCSYDPAKPVCDTSTKTCVGCLGSNDCTYDPNKKVCDTSTQLCVSCLQSSHCTYVASKPVCATASKTCVECVQSTDCTAPSKVVCESATNTCVACLGSSDCTYDPNKQICDVSSKSCVECLANADCTADPTRSICDGTTSSCRRCQAHTECNATGQGGVCAADGSCPDETKITYVDASATGGTADGSKQNPYVKIEDAIGKTNKYVFVRAGTYGDTAFSKSHEVYAEPGAVIKATGCDKVVIESNVKVLLSGFLIEGNVKVKDSGTTGRLVGNTIGPSACIGVNATGGDPTLILRRNLVYQHTGGGVNVDGFYTIENNFIVENGGTAATFGGVKLKPQTSTQVFSNNTVADNTSKGNNPSEAAVRCEGTVQIHNSIVWDNINDLGLATQLDPDCEPHHCDAQDGLPGPFPDSNGNISEDPDFKKTGTGADQWHLGPSSPCNGKADPGKAPPIDYDGDSRSTTAPDIGADEI